MDRVTLNEGEVVFGSWKNGEQNKALYDILANPLISAIKDEATKNMAIGKMLQEKLLCFSIQNGSGILTSPTITETKKRIDDLEGKTDGVKLTEGFNKFCSIGVEEVKKKAD